MFRTELQCDCPSDLSRNRLCELPEELCHFISLETLILYHNGMRSLSSGICNLQALTYLNIRYLQSAECQNNQQYHSSVVEVTKF